MQFEAGPADVGLEMRRRRNEIRTVAAMPDLPDRTWPAAPGRPHLSSYTYPATPIPRAIPDAANTMTTSSTACQWPIRT